MNELIQFFREFGNLINIALLLSLLGIAFKIFRATIVQKDAELAVIRERIGLIEAFSVDKVVEKFQSLKEYYEVHVQTWYEKSIEQLEEEKRKAIESKKKEFQKKIEKEIEKRKSLIKKYTKQIDSTLRGTIPKLTGSKVCGKYTVVGHNPFMPEFSYFGDLHITEKDEVLLGKWKIGPMKQRHEGIGILAGNMLAFNFKYTELNGGTSTGIVLYEIISDDVMRGYWTGFGVSHVGFEECRKKNPNE